MIQDQQDLLSAAKAIVKAMENNAAPSNLKASLREVEKVEIDASLLLALAEAVEEASGAPTEKRTVKKIPLATLALWLGENKRNSGLSLEEEEMLLVYCMHLATSRDTLRKKPESADAEIARLEASLARYQEADPDEIESDEYAAILTRLTKLREERDERYVVRGQFSGGDYAGDDHVE